jgi:NAD+ kinase
VNRSNILPPFDGVYEQNYESKPFEKLSLILTRPHLSVKDTGESDFLQKIAVILLTFSESIHDQFVDFKRWLPIESRTFRLTIRLDHDVASPMKTKSIGILTKPKFPEVKATLQAVVTWLRARNIDVLLDTTSATLLGELGGIQKTHLASKAGVILVLGGDGTMLNAARLAADRGIPILGVNMGGLGFLTEVRLEHLYPSLERVFANEFVLDERLMLKTHVHRHGETVTQGVVLNDVVISKGTLARMIELKVAIQGQFVTNLRGDGLIVSTPTGSTAYSLSAGGPIIDPAVQSLILTPICPHTLTHRPLIVPSHAEIEVTLTSKDDGAMATLDGQVGISMTQGDTVAIQVSEHRTRLIRFPETHYYDVLREKLNWGDR